MNSPDVSVIMTVYNGEQFLEHSIESICRQTLTDFEFVIVDDGSKDQTFEILSRVAKKDPRMKVICGPHLGRAKALNQAWKNTVGRYVAIFDADDYSEPDRLEKQLSFYQQHPEVGLLGTARNFIDDGGKNVYSKPPLLHDKELRKALIKHVQFAHSSVMIPRHVLERVGGYNENIQVAIDYDMCVRVACCYPIANLPQKLVTIRFRSSSFFAKINDWLRYKTVVRIRWKAWQNFSGSLIDLAYVINPFGILDRGIKNQLRPIYKFLVQN